MVHRLTRRDARRIAVRAQLLDASRPTDLLSVIRHLCLIQVDLTAAVAPNVDLVCWSRLGAAYEPAELDDLLDSGRVVEYAGLLRPGEDIALFRAQMTAWPGEEVTWRTGLARWLTANQACHDDILAILRSDGPTVARDLPDTCVVPWRSSGWNNNRNVPRMLDLMEARGEIAVASREGRERLWDLAERVYPTTDVVDAESADPERDRRRLTSLGIARASMTKPPGEPWDVGDAGEEAVMEGVRGTWRVDPAQLGLPFRGRAALLSPLDRLVVDRKRLTEIFQFDYQLEMYKPVAKRRWGYFALPILYGDSFVGKLDAASDLDAGLLRVNAVHEDVDFTAAMTRSVDREIESLAQFLGLRVSRS
ncbi:crosslink repair DNA glycosylase YcaQ family protein [Allobranchiibius sp. GilTou38]|uniref:DNA glycosylase AlkZ-like family protein n=1 Tax=Allobranchiibius sp. GilTou38 TaxID=2815210 RepID=UPI001AA0EB84|nr:crosslink repair DNA glycosylase YcaQ family protein [Allobranchiibius sp. GilTou38]MBO1768131.1 YcaQ family DNA glycosylase [Allobranchiibius sp. GilTou38]